MHLRLRASAALILLLPSPPSAGAQAPAPREIHLMISARRIEMGGTRRTAELYLMNPSSRKRSYRLAVGYRDMDEQGDTRERPAPKEGERPWSELLRISPRQVSPDPGQSQVIRMAILRPAVLAPGEYRYHLTVTELPEPESAPVPASGRGLELSMQPLLGVSIPVIYRYGDLHGRSGLADLAFVPAAQGGKARLSFWLTRSGEASSYGNLRATFVPPGAPEETVAELKGVAVYTNLPRRAVNLTLERSGGLPFGPGRLHLTFTPEGARRAEAQADLVLR